MSEPKDHRCASSPAASSWILRWLARLSPGDTVLDFAAGSGRHALAACGLGLQVLAVDRDEQALAHARSGKISLRVADLEVGPWPFAAHERFDAVLVANYLFRPRFALLASLVAPGGLLVYETFAQGNERYGRPSNPAFLLAPGELLVRSRRAGLTVLGYETGITNRPAAAVVQRICATRSRDTGALASLG
ncbi:MAG: 50S ribosomal protein L11 methyltransferase [Burkholderiaceae bacterium]|nr:50S ribosomal protein L11 methyltransferase [Burkholderiaceae bacterium]